jgi:hypothetical protein
VLTVGAIRDYFAKQSGAEAQKEYLKKKDTRSFKREEPYEKALFTL